LHFSLRLCGCLGRSILGALLAKHLSTFQAIEDSLPPTDDVRSGRGGGTRFFVQAFLRLWLLMCFSVAATAQVNVYTRSYDNARTGANLQETTLTPANVNSTNFGKLFTFHTDGEIYAQPLYVSNLAIAGGTHNVVFVASMLNTVYALDADTGTELWSQNFGSPIIPKDVENLQNISFATGLGILTTPVIDPTTNIMYFVSGSQPANGAQQYSFNLNAIEIATGLPVSGSPVTIAATYSTPDLTTPLVFSAQTQNPRPGLALGNGNVYIAFASHNDMTPYNGWVLAYSTSTLAQTAVYSDTTTGTQGGIWNSGQAPTIDAAGNLYISTGNGSFGATANKLEQTGNSFIKLSPTLQLLDYFTPYNSAVMNSGDMDLGSTGLLLIPNTSYVLGGSKQGVLYLVDTTAMGEFNASSDNVRQEFQAVYGVGTSHLHGTPVYFDSDLNGPTTYVWGENDVLRGLLFNTTTGLLSTTPFATSAMTAPATNNDGAMPGGFLSVSANGNSNGILWASTPYNGDAANQSVQGVLYAFNADTLSLLWTDKTNDARDEIGMFAKYVPPVVANGKVYVPSFGPVGNTDGSGNLVVYGLLQPLPTLTVTANNATRVYGAANPTFSGTVTGAQTGDAFTESFATTATTTSAVGSYPIVPSVTGSNLGNYTVNIVNGTLTVTAAATTTTLTAPGSGATYGANETLTATVASTAGTPGGTVTFYSGATALGTGTLNSSGVATLSTTALPAGTDTVTATYAAAGNFAASTSAPVTLTVIASPVAPAGSYAVSANPSSLTVAAGQATTTLTFAPTGGYSGTIALSCSNLPTNVSCAFAQKQVTLSGDNQSVNVGLTINTTAQQAGKHAPQSPLSPTLFALAFWWPGGLTGLAAFLRGRIQVKTQHSWHLGLLLVSTCAFAAGLSSCGTSGTANGAPPATSSQVTVVATGTSGTVVSTQTVTLSLMMTQ
jgi:hypothetical protein